MAQLKDEIEQGAYRVDPKAVADAIVRRLAKRRPPGLERMLEAGQLAVCIDERNLGEPVEHPPDPGHPDPR